MAERDLIEPAGLPDRPWYRHVIYAPGLYTGYGVKTIPGVREAVDAGNYARAAEQAAIVIRALQRATKTLQKGAGSDTWHRSTGHRPRDSADLHRDLLPVRRDRQDPLAHRPVAAGRTARRLGAGACRPARGATLYLERVAMPYARVLRARWCRSARSPPASR